MKRWVLVSAVGLGTAAACGPTTRNPAAQRYAETYCRAVERCECVERFASTDAVFATDTGTTHFVDTRLGSWDAGQNADGSRRSAVQ